MLLQCNVHLLNSKYHRHEACKSESAQESNKMLEIWFEIGLFQQDIPSMSHGMNIWTESHSLLWTQSFS